MSTATQRLRLVPVLRSISTRRIDAGTVGALAMAAGLMVLAEAMGVGRLATAIGMLLLYI
jgi:hypothetical protein